MKRNEIITKLIAEGFSADTLANFNDKQLSILSGRVLSEEVGLTTVGTTTPASQIVHVKGGTPAEKELQMQKKSYITYESELDEAEKWIQKAIKKPGSLKKALGVKQDETIPASKLNAAAKKGGKLGKRARLAKTLKSLNETDTEETKKSKDKDKLILSNKPTEVKEASKVPVVEPGKKPAKKTVSENVTTKNEIMELIKVKLNEQATNK